MNDMGSDYPKAAACGWNFIVLMSRQGKIRLSEFFSSYTEGEKRRILRDIAADVLPRQPKMCNIIEKGEYKFVYRRYASLYFVAGIPPQMNELIVLEQIHLFVEALDGYFNSGKLGLLTQTVCNFFWPSEQWTVNPPNNPSAVVFSFLVCELDLVFSLHKSLIILFEMFIGGMLCESNKREVLNLIVEAEELVEESAKRGEDTASQLDDGLSFQEQFQLGRKPGRRTGAAGGAGR
jgi:AP-1 complex subunit sigma 1/2